MNEYEARRLEKIKKNEELLAGLNIQRVVVAEKTRNAGGQPERKRRRLDTTTPTRTSSRIAAAPVQPSYNEDVAIKAVPLPRSAAKKTASKTNGKTSSKLASQIIEDTEPLVPTKNVEEIKEGWTSWKATSTVPERDDNMVFHFADYPDFTPNLSPEEMLRQGCFGGSYYRPLRSRKLGIVVEEDWEELPKEWISGLDVDKYLTSPLYDPDVNKFKVSCGQSIEEWEAAGWISHEHDVRGWFQWYTRFYRGRRCDDDERQVSRWKKCVGNTGRWRRTLLKKYVALGVREVFDDGADEDGPEVSPVVHQTCHHWAYEVRQPDLDAFWNE